MKTISHQDPDYPARLRERLGEAAPEQLTSLGNLDLLALPKTGLFCSRRCPGHVILPTYDLAARWRVTGRCIISGFHSLLERECLRILLRGTAPIIFCPARTLPERIPAGWRTPLAEGRMLILSGFASADKRVTNELAERRNAIVAALSDEVCFAHIRPGGQTERLTHRLIAWDVPFSNIDKD
jgi:predicted Rossmann fold nucleotide-binding protein DprA/Smf involved in DNA uptake